MHRKQLTRDQCLKMLDSHMVLKNKRLDRNIKGRTVAGGNKYQSYIPKEDASSTTVATESLLLTCIIDAEENRDFSVIDILNV